MALCSLWKSSGKNHLADESLKLFVESLNRLQDFRVNDTLTDLTLTVGETSFRAHKLILSVHSKVFEAMLTHQMLEARRGEVCINDESSHIFSLFLNYVYTGAVPNDLQLADAVDLFVCADKYQVESLVVLCEKVISSRLDPKNVVKILFMAETYRRPFLKKRSAAYICLYITDVMKSEDWPLIRTNPSLLKKLIIWSSKKVIGSLLVDSIKYELRTLRDSLCLKVAKFTGIQFIEWSVAPDMRPVEFKLNSSRQPEREMTSFCIIFDWSEKRDSLSELVAHIFPHSRLKSAHVTAYCRLSLWDDERRAKLSEKENLLTWCADSAHPTMGNRRAEVFRSIAPSKGAILECSIEVHVGMSPEESKVLEPWVIEKVTEEVVEVPTPLSKPVVMKFNNEGRFTVDNDHSSLFPSLYLQPHKCPLPSLPEEHYVSSLSKTTACHIVNYINTGLLPSGDNVDLQLLKGAWELQLSDLIVYLEHALVNKFDPTNSIDALLLGHSLGLGFLKWGALQYLKANLDRVIRLDKNWPDLEAHLLEQLLFEQNREWAPCLLPPCLVYREDTSHVKSDIRTT